MYEAFQVHKMNEISQSELSIRPLATSMSYRLYEHAYYFVSLPFRFHDLETLELLEL